MPSLPLYCRWRANTKHSSLLSACNILVTTNLNWWAFLFVSETQSKLSSNFLSLLFYSANCKCPQYVLGFFSPSFVFSPTWRQLSTIPRNVVPCKGGQHFFLSYLKLGFVTNLTAAINNPTKHRPSWAWTGVFSCLWAHQVWGWTRPDASAPGRTWTTLAARCRWPRSACGGSVSGRWQSWGGEGGSGCLLLSSLLLLPLLAWLASWHLPTAERKINICVMCLMPNKKKKKKCYS
jgi:hypothetical protein